MNNKTLELNVVWTFDCITVNRYLKNINLYYSSYICRLWYYWSSLGLVCKVICNCKEICQGRIYTLFACRCRQWHYREDQRVWLWDDGGADVFVGQSKRRGVLGDLQRRRAGVSDDGDRALLRTMHCTGDTRQRSSENIPWVRRTCRSGKPSELGRGLPWKFVVADGTHLLCMLLVVVQYFTVGSSAVKPQPTNQPVVVFLLLLIYCTTVVVTLLSKLTDRLVALAVKTF